MHLNFILIKNKDFKKYFQEKNLNHMIAFVPTIDLLKINFKVNFYR